MANAPTTTTSTRFTLNAKDLIKGAIVAALVPVFTIIINSINEGEPTFNWNNIWKTAVAAFLGYLLKNWLTPSQVVISDPEAAKAVKEGKLDVSFKEK